MWPSLLPIFAIVGTLEIVYFIIARSVLINFKLYLLGSVMVYLAD